MASLHGSLDLLILKAVAAQRLNGVEISRRISQLTEDTIEVSYGSLFPALHRMEEKGWLVAQWNASENNRNAKYYQLTKKGRKQLAEEERDWNRVTKAVLAALRAE
jgi:transcriptional regulator